MVRRTMGGMRYAVASCVENSEREGGGCGYDGCLRGSAVFRGCMDMVPRRTDVVFRKCTDVLATAVDLGPWARRSGFATAGWCVEIM